MKHVVIVTAILAVSCSVMAPPKRASKAEQRKLEKQLSSRRGSKAGPGTVAIAAVIVDRKSAAQMQREMEEQKRAKFLAQPKAGSGEAGDRRSGFFGGLLGGKSLKGGATKDAQEGSAGGSGKPGHRRQRSRSETDLDAAVAEAVPDTVPALTAALTKRLQRDATSLVLLTRLLAVMRAEESPTAGQKGRPRSHSRAGASVRARSSERTRSRRNLNVLAARLTALESTQGVEEGDTAGDVDLEKLLAEIGVVELPPPVASVAGQIVFADLPPPPPLPGEDWPNP